MSDEDRRLTVSVQGESTGRGAKRYRLMIWKPGGGSGLPTTFSNRAKAERVARWLERELGPEQERENAELDVLIAEMSK